MNGWQGLPKRETRKTKENPMDGQQKPVSTDTGNRNGAMPRKGRRHMEKAKPGFSGRIRATAAALLALAATAYGFSAPVHEAEMADVFARIEGAEFREAANRISSAIDNDLLESFRKNIGKVPGNHRIVGHG